uniref:HGWP repeat containing protein-like n=1 Tax=Oryza sativa subsp. japonica TaxID=39947 RepID=Q6ZFQ6_ORYSJ|nr:HGWP repeat containing protein-like [Oryza sativa Japonica Group]
MTAGPPAPVSFPSGRSLPLPTLFKPSPHLLRPFSPLAAVAAELWSAAVVAPDRLPPRRRLLRLRHILADLVHLSVSVADRRNTVDPVDPSRAAASLLSDRPLRRRRRPGVSRGPSPPFPLPSPLSIAAPPRRWLPAATIGARARRLPPTTPAWPPSCAPSGCRVGPGRQPPTPSGAADVWGPRRRSVRAGCARSTVDREAAAWAPLPWTRSARPSPSADAINPF